MMRDLATGFAFTFLTLACLASSSFFLASYIIIYQNLLNRDWKEPREHSQAEILTASSSSSSPKRSISSSSSFFLGAASSFLGAASSSLAGASSFLAGAAFFSAPLAGAGPAHVLRTTSLNLFMRTHQAKVLGYVATLGTVFLRASKASRSAEVGC